MTVQAGDAAWIVLVTATPGFAASTPPQAHIGLGAVDSIDLVVATVPGQGDVAIVGPLSADRRISWAP